VEAILQWGLDLIVAIQQFRGPVLDGLFRVVSSLGEPEFHLFLLPSLLWCVDFGLGARVGVFLLLSSYLNLYLKNLFQQPRPYYFDPNLQLIPVEEEYGLPSGHAQLAIVLWGSIAAWARKSWFWGLAIVLMALIGFSRIYLGVHFPTDVLAGWAVGAISLGLYLATQPRVERWLAGLTLVQQVLLALIVPLLLFLTHPVKNTATATGTLAGAGAGLALTNRYVPFNAGGPFWQRALRFLIGSAIVVPLYLGFKTVSPGEESALYLGFRFLSFGLIGLWSSLGAPWLFRLLRLTPGREGDS
jgi:membrane-associated phospholipid phosphatase